MRVAFLGPPGTFTEEALEASAVERWDKIAYPTVYETVMAVHDQDAERAVVPIENSLEGSVTATLDTLAGDAADVCIASELVHPIHQCLIARPGTAQEQIARVFSHPQATAQCARFLRTRLAAAERVSVPSTAEAVRIVADSSKAWAAIGSALAAQRYGCDVLARRIEDSAENLTRFVWLAPREAGLDADATKTSVVFWGFNDESPGALVSVLKEFSEREINLTKIESRPRHARLGRYMFFADLEGSIRDAPVAEALEALGRRVESLRVLGSYPAASSAI